MIKELLNLESDYWVLEETAHKQVVDLSSSLRGGGVYWVQVTAHSLRGTSRLPHYDEGGQVVGEQV